jgi:hypothetical protein
MLERDVEKAFVKGVQDIGCITRKLNGVGYRSWPDRLVITPDGGHIYIELKAPGEEPTPKQRILMKKLRDQHCCVAWYDNAKDAIEAVFDFINGWFDQKEI